MKTTILVLAALSGILHAQGPLAPPAGPAPTMKSLDQIEPRTPISSLPYVISESGSYYFTGNLQFTAASGDAITIAASNVTLDLMGFTLSSTAAVTGFGINVQTSSTGGITIHNGVIAGNTTVTVSGSPSTWTSAKAGFNTGIYNRSSHASIKDVTVRGARETGVFSPNYTTIDNLRAHENGSSGITVSSGSVTNSTATNNGGAGISAPLGTVTNSIASFNARYGFYVDAGSVTNSIAKNNGDFGMFARDGSVTNSIANNNENGIYADSGSVTNSTARYNNTVDIAAANAVVAFCSFTTFSMTGSTRTGNYPSP